MNDNGASRPERTTASQLRYLTWHTPDPISLVTGPVTASGDASPMVRSQTRVSELGDLDAQIAHVQAIIIESLADVLAGLEPAAQQLPALRAEIAAATLILANTRLAAHGISLLDLTVDQVSIQR
jgi:hypothetical protein